MPDRESRLTRSSLIVKLRRRSSSGWTQLIDLFGELVLKQIARENVQPADAADISQNVLEAVLTGIDRYHHDSNRSGSFRAWLYGITRHKIADFYRDNAKHPQAHSQAIEPEWNDSSGDAELIDDIRPIAAVIENVRRDFTPQTWQVFWRSAVHGEIISNVARELGLSSTAARQAKYRVTMRLRDEIDSLDMI